MSYDLVADSSCILGPSHRVITFASSCMLVAILASVSGCKNDFTICEPECTCTEPDASGPAPDSVANNGDSHQEFNLKVDNLTNSPIAPREFHDIDFQWTVSYPFDPCKCYHSHGGELESSTSSTPGYSGDFTVRWTLTDCATSEVLLSGSEAVNLLMDGPSKLMTAHFEGAEVSGDVPATTRPLCFDVHLELADAGQECTNDPATDLVVDNAAGLNFVVGNCVCDGFESKSFAPGSLEWDGATTLTWTNSYVRGVCTGGQEDDDITESTGAYTEHIEIAFAAGGTVSSVDLPGSPVDLNTSLSRDYTLPELNSGDYVVTITLTGFGPNVECNESVPNSASLAIHIP